MVCVQTRKGYVHQGKYLTGNIIAGTQSRVCIKQGSSSYNAELLFADLSSLKKSWHMQISAQSARGNKINFFAIILYFIKWNEKNIKKTKNHLNS